MGELRDRMARDLKLAGYSPSTTRIYLYYANCFAAYYMRSPEEMGDEEVRSYLLHLLDERKLSHGTYRQGFSALKFLYRHTIQRPMEVEFIPRRKKFHALPDVLSGTEVSALLSALTKPRYRVITSAIYAAGLRVTEACSLQIRDIDPSRKVIHVRRGKGNVDRYVMLSDRLLRMLRDWWKIDRPDSYLFPGRGASGHISSASVRLALRLAAAKAGIRKRVTPHLLRHAFATHLLEAGTDLAVIQALLGHRRVRQTTHYLRIRPDHVRRTQSPLDLLGTPAGHVLG